MSQMPMNITNIINNVVKYDPFLPDTGKVNPGHVTVLPTQIVDMFDVFVADNAFAALDEITDVSLAAEVNELMREGLKNTLPGDSTEFSVAALKLGSLILHELNTHLSYQLRQAVARKLNEERGL